MRGKTDTFCVICRRSRTTWRRSRCGWRTRVGCCTTSSSTAARRYVLSGQKCKVCVAGWSSGPQCPVRKGTGSQVDVILNKEGELIVGFIGSVKLLWKLLGLCYQGTECSCPVCTLGYAHKVWFGTDLYLSTGRRVGDSSAQKGMGVGRMIFVADYEQ